MLSIHRSLLAHVIIVLVHHKDKLLNHSAQTVIHGLPLHVNGVPNVHDVVLHFETGGERERRGRVRHRVNSIYND